MLETQLNRRRMIALIVVFIAVSAGIACIRGIQSGMRDETFTFVTPRGETLEFQSEGIYQYNPRSFTAEGIGWDIVTVVIGIPVLVISLLLFNKGSLRAGIVLAGMLAYFFYQYLLYVTGWAYNSFFLLYTALYSLSAIALILVVQVMGVGTLGKHVSERIPRKSLAGFMFFIAGFLSFLWLGQIVPALIRGEAPALLNGLNTLVVQAFDLGLLVPVALSTGVLLLRRNPWGYLLASIGIVKFFMMALAIIAMVVVRSIVEQESALAEISIFAVLALVAAAFLMRLLRAFRTLSSGVGM